MAVLTRCPKCYRPLVERVNRETNEPFLGCTGYTQRNQLGQPSCSFTQQLPLHIRLRKAGHKALPGFE